MSAFAAPPVSAFRGRVLANQSASTKSRHSIRSCSRQIAASVAPREDRRAAEIERLRQQLAELKAKQSEAPTGSDVAPVQPKAQNDTAKKAPAQAAPSGPFVQRLGKHNEGSHFVGIKMLDGTQFMPKVLPVIGSLPGIKAETVRNAPRVGGGKPEAGCIPWSMMDGSFKGEIVAIECPTEAIGLAEDLVAMRVSDIGVVAPTLTDLSSKEDAVLVLDRSADAKAFDDLKFYAWDVKGEVHIGWVKDEPAPTEATCLGRVLVVVTEEDKEKAKAKSCWGEVEDVF